MWRRMFRVLASALLLIGLQFAIRALPDARADRYD